MTDYKVILVGTDGSETSLRAVEEAAAIAAKADAKLIVASAYQDAGSHGTGVDPDQASGEGYRTEGNAPVYAMLRDGRLAGAALDVLAEEPLQPDNRFLALPNVIVTPHIGGATVDVTRHQSEIVVDAIERHLRGERPRWIANPAVLERRV